MYLNLIDRLESVWEAKLNTVCQYRDYYGRRIYIYRPGTVLDRLGPAVLG
jgi:hypothetical protein